MWWLTFHTDTLRVQHVSKLFLHRQGLSRSQVVTVGREVRCVGFQSEVRHPCLWKRQCGIDVVLWVYYWDSYPGTPSLVSSQHNSSEDRIHVKLVPNFQMRCIELTLNYNRIFKQQCSFRGSHDDVIKRKHFPRYWPFVKGIHRWPVNSPHKGQWRGALLFSLIYAWINASITNRQAGDLRRHSAHFDVMVMCCVHMRAFS